MKKVMSGVLALLLACSMLLGNVYAFADDSGWDTPPVCLEHNFVRMPVKPATTKEDGYSEIHCKNCDAVLDDGSRQVIPSIKSVTLSCTQYTYDGKAKTPKVTVKDRTGKVIAAENYTVSYVNNKAAGKNTYAKIVFKGNYSGEMTAKFSILLAKPAKPKVSAKTSASAVKLSWKKVTGAQYYRIYSYNTSTKQYKGIANTKNLSYTVKKLKAGTTYYYLVRSFYVMSNNEKSYSPYTVKDNVKAVTLCAAPRVKASVSGKTVTLKWAKCANAKFYKVFQYNAKTKKYTALKRTTALSAKLSAQAVGTHYYLVRAYNSASTGSAYSTKNLAKAVVKATTTASKTVYITRTGKRYHYDSKCGNGTYYKSTLAQAKKAGLTPCQKCVH